MVDAAYYQDLLRPIFAGRKLVIVIKPHQERTHEHALASDAGAYRVARPGETAAASLLIGPSTVGGFLRFTPDPAQMPVGPSIAPRVVAAFALADREFGTGLGPLTPATDLRR